MCSTEATTSVVIETIEPPRPHVEENDNAGWVEILEFQPEPSRIDREWVGQIVQSPGRFYEFTKRLIDIVAGVVLLVMAMPIMIVSAVAIKITSRGGVFFGQKRAGLDGRTFTMYKFRSMYHGAEEARPVLEKLNESDGPAFKIRNDPRVTPLGRFLRRSSIDELPQLINVLAGQMSLVGPRPLPVSEADNVRGKARMRTSVKPGLTCLWQISGRNELTFRQWAALDLYYIRHRSLFLDLMIIVQTIPAVLSARGAY